MFKQDDLAGIELELWNAVSSQGAADWSAATFTVLGWALALCLAAGVGRMFKTR